MKKVSIFLSIIFIILFLSCKNNTESKLSFTEENTIKNTVKEKEQSITWSKELEGDRLSEKVSSSNNKVSSEVIYNIDVVNILSDFQSPIYPEFENFGKLDTTSLSGAAKEKIISFCNGLADLNKQQLQSSFNSKYIFNYVFFLEELKNNWKNNFNEDFPEELKEDEKLFSKWIIGEPFNGEEIIQIPVRFYCKQGTLDVTLYLNIKQQYSIYQAAISGWK